MNLQSLKIKLQELDIRPNKKLGQNFLINEAIASGIAKKVQESPAPWLEVGPGLGALTEFFNAKKEQTILIEKDKKLASYWEKKDFKVFCEDALKFNWDQIQTPFTLFGNLPFQIAGSLVLEMSLRQNSLLKMIFMMQKEVAVRVLARSHTKDYGLLSVIAQTFWKPKLLFSVGKRDFYPVPKVNAWVLEFSPKPLSLSPVSFLKFIKMTFAHRRKKLIKQLPKEFFVDWEMFFTNQKWDFNLRTEELSPPQLLALYQEFTRLNQSKFARHLK